MTRSRVVMISGGFDPLHVGHLDLIEAAGRIGQVLVAVNSDDWLMRKKAYVFMPLDDRMRLVEALSCVKGVVAAEDGDGTVCATLRRYSPNVFANGGDRNEADPREHAVCEELGIVQRFCVGGGKTRSSSELVRALRS